MGPRKRDRSRSSVYDSAFRCSWKEEVAGVVPPEKYPPFEGVCSVVVPQVVLPDALIARKLRRLRGGMASREEGAQAEPAQPRVEPTAAQDEQMTPFETPYESEDEVSLGSEDEEAPASADAAGEASRDAAAVPTEVQGSTVEELELRVRNAEARQYRAAQEVAAEKRRLQQARAFEDAKRGRTDGASTSGGGGGKQNRTHEGGWQTVKSRGEKRARGQGSGGGKPRNASADANRAEFERLAREYNRCYGCGRHVVGKDLAEHKASCVRSKAEFSRRMGIVRKLVKEGKAATVNEFPAGDNRASGS